MLALVRAYILKKKSLLMFTVLISLISCFVSVTQVFATQIYLTVSSGDVSVGDVVPVEVRLDTADTAINVVEGTITLGSENNDVEMREISVAGADLTLWTRKPSWAKESQTVAFVGGEPGGIDSDSMLLFRMFVIPQSKGEIKVVPNVTAFANDGKGTPVPVIATPIIITVGNREATSTDQWRDRVSSDNTPPIIISAEIGKDESLYEGKWFLVIRAEDSESGIDYFEIKEGERDPVRSGSEYLLQDQDQSTNIIIAAFDKAGNMQLLEISPLQKSIRGYLYGGIIIGIVVIISVIILRRKKKDT